MTAVALRELAPDDSQAGLDILNQMWGAAPSPGTRRSASAPAVESAEEATAPATNEVRRARGSRGHLRLVTPGDPAPETPVVTPTITAAVAESFFAKQPAPRTPVQRSLPLTAMALGMPRLARWLRTGAMLYAGSMTAALIAGTVLWPR